MIWCLDSWGNLTHALITLTRWQIKFQGCSVQFFGLVLSIPGVAGVAGSIPGIGAMHGFYRV